MKIISKAHLGPTLAVLVFALAVTGVTSASAHDNDTNIVFRYLVGSGFTELGQVCNLGVPCPPAAKASNGDTIEMSGEGKLSILRENGKPRSVTGGGSFIHKDATGHVRSVGTWTAKKLLRFDPFGPGVGTPPTWEAGARNSESAFSLTQGQWRLTRCSRSVATCLGMMVPRVLLKA